MEAWPMENHRAEHWFSAASESRRPAHPRVQGEVDERGNSPIDSRFIPCALGLRSASVPQPLDSAEIHPLEPQRLTNTRIPTLVFETSHAASKYVAVAIAELIRRNNARQKPTVLGLATGATPVALYAELVRMHREEGLDFSRVITFNLDEYYPMSPSDPNSYHEFMRVHLFDHINIPRENIYIPDGSIPLERVESYCREYEQLIREAGGIDIQILGIGRTGHIAFNEPGSPRSSRTRLVTLDPLTRHDAAQAFFGEEHVPTRALTMGVGTILDARKIFILAFGERKAAIVQKAAEELPTEAVTASFLQEHHDATFILDEPAASKLSARLRPWELGSIHWTDALIRQAVIWLSLKVGKGLLQLDDDDFRENGLYELLREYGPAQDLGERVFQDRLATLVSHPAGRDAKTILVFSPHPDDDVISMGGTMIRLAEQGHMVHVAYMTSGNIAVFDYDALRFVDFVESYNREFGIDPVQTSRLANQVRQALETKEPGQADCREVLEIKRLIRETEARAAAAVCGIPPHHLEFMNLKFYQTGKREKLPVQPEDYEAIMALLQRLKPAQIYVAGEMSDPHGTHRVCAEAIYTCVRKLRQQGQQFEVWLYRGAWEEWEPHEIDRAVPISPADLERKKLAIFRHQSQKDRAMFPGGSDRREFWQRAEERNKGTAATYDALGLPEFFALEAFVRWKG
jgi:glucosamine-6-phosphate deaminase